MTSATKLPASHQRPDFIARMAADADRLFLGVTALLAVISLVLAFRGGSWAAFAALTLPALVASAAVTRLVPGSLLSSCTIAAAWMLCTAALIHQSHGLPEAHFSVILLIAMLLYYRDWRPIVTAAAVIAVHHVGFFLAQTQGMPIAVFAAGAGWGTLLVHAAYVVVESALLTVMALQMRKQLLQIGHDPHELGQIAQAVVDERELPASLEAARFPPGSLARALLEANSRQSARRGQQQQDLQQMRRISAALENVTANVMIADSDRTIVFVNLPLQQMLARVEKDLRKELPQFSAATLIGSTIDVFHKNPSHQANLLAKLEQTHRAQIRIGGHVMRLIINPVYAEDGQRVGYVVEWADRTNEVQVEAELERIVQAAAAGDFDGRVTTEGKEGFFLDLANHLNQLLEASASSIDQISRVFAALARGDLSVRMEGDFKGLYQQINDNANATVEELTRIVSSIQQASRSINDVANELAHGSGNLSARTEQQAAGLEETAAAMDELTSTVRQNAHNAQQANTLAMDAASVAGEGGQVVGQVVETMEQIQQSSRRIGEIIAVIDGIAFQTNILALNAAVEAARAGDQGRGFAVVAAEVRTLAQRSAGAAKEIRQLIDDSAERVSSGAALVQRAGATMAQIVDSVRRVHDIMGQISSASQEQSQGIEQVNKSIAQMDAATRQNAELVDDSLSATRNLGQQADQLATAVARFKLADDPTGALMQQLQRMAALEE